MTPNADYETGEHSVIVCSNFLSDGWWAECSCGWRGAIADSAGDAMKVWWREHPSPNDGARA